MVVCGQRHASAAYIPGKDAVPIVQEAGWAPGPFWIGAENFAPTGFRSPDLPARSESLYQLRYPGLKIICSHWGSNQGSLFPKNIAIMR